MYFKKPYRKTYRKKTYRKKKTYPKSTGKTLSIPKPKVYPFSRTKEYVLELENPANGWIETNDNALVKTFDFNLAELENYTEFTSLFSQYKLNMVMLKIFPSGSTLGSFPQSSTQNMIITVWPNTHGTPLTVLFTNNQLLEIQRKRTFMFPLNRPTQLKMYLKQLSNTYAGTINNDYATVKPRYISTGEASTPHYGMNVHIRRLDGTAFGVNSLRLLFREKIYLTCKQVS